LKPFLQTISETGPYFYSRPSLGKWLKKGKALEQRLGPFLHFSVAKAECVAGWWFGQGRQALFHEGNPENRHAGNFVC